jgi:Na+-transporting NADH:ubiquinone oxidoreductase subunit NqrB
MKGSLDVVALRGKKYLPRKERDEILFRIARRDEIKSSALLLGILYSVVVYLLASTWLVCIVKLICPF